MEAFNLKYVRYAEIDKIKWDHCIDHAANGLVYAYSWYLDHMADQWDAIVMNDYSAVFPLPFRKKYGINYLYQPAFTAQLGVFGNDISAELMKAFIQAIPLKFRLVELNLNAGNPVDNTDNILLRHNYVLDLSAPYQNIQQQYRDNVKRNSKKAVQYQLTFSEEVSISEVIQLSKLGMGTKTNLLGNDYARFEKLVDLLVKKGTARIFGVRNEKKQLLASAVFFFSHHRAYYIIVGNHPNGKTLGASHFLIDNVIRKYSGQQLLLDFEGSDISSLAFFYSSFGAILETYPALRIYRLPWWAKIFKKN